MFNVLLLLIVLTLTTRTAQAQPPAPSDNPSNLINLPAGKFLWWYGYTGRTYFIQVSDIDNPLGKWNWAPIIEAGNNAPISYEVDGTASKKFFRLKPTDLPIPAGKTIDTADFDQDGISNIDEINPPPPLSASDATDPLNPDNDGDGMSDIWEKSFAVSLLALGRPAAYWGANYAALVSGTLDSDIDYTGEGITAGELAAYDALPAAQQPADGVHKQSKDRRNILAWGVHRPANGDQPEKNEGLYFNTNDGYYGPGYAITTQFQLTPAYLAQQVLLNSWGEFSLEDGFSRFWTTDNTSSTSYSGEIRTARTRMLRLKPEMTAVTKNFLKTTSRSNNPLGANPTYEAEVVTVSIPPGKLLSQWAELTPPVIENSVHRVELHQVEVGSMDRYLTGSLPETVIGNLGGDTKFGIVFRNTSSGETYSFNKLSEAHVYENPFGATDEEEDKFLSNSEIAAWADGPNTVSKELTQDVVFYRKGGKLHFRTIFNQVGPIEIGFLKDGQEIAKIEWTLKPDAQIADLLETVDNILSGRYDDGGGIVVAAMQAGLNEEDINALQSAAASIQSSNSSGSGGFLCRNLTIKVNIPTWEALKGKFEDGARKAGAAVDRAITIATFAGKGFCEGAWLGIKDDLNSVIELGKMILNPAETAKTFYEGFEALMQLDLEGWKNAGTTLVKSFLEKGNEGVGEWGTPNALDVASYLVGFTCGYITEQVIVTYITAGGVQALKAGKIGREIGRVIKAASQSIIPALERTASNTLRVATIKAKNAIFRRFSQDILSVDEVKKLKHMLQELESICSIPVSP